MPKKKTPVMSRQICVKATPRSPHQNAEMQKQNEDADEPAKAKEERGKQRGGVKSGAQERGKGP